MSFRIQIFLKIILANMISPGESEEASYKCMNTLLYQNMNIHTNILSGQSDLL